MIIENDGRIIHTMLAKSHIDGFMADYTSDGIFVENDYRIEYTIFGYKGKMASLNLKASDLMKGIGTVMRLTKQNFGSFDVVKARETSSAFTNIWASLVIDKSIKMRRRLIDQYGSYFVNSISKMMRGSRKDRDLLKDLIAGYMFIRKMLDDDATKFDPAYRILSVQDRPAHDGFCANWENEPITKRLDIKSVEEFRDICRNGVIQPEWKAAA